MFYSLPARQLDKADSATTILHEQARRHEWTGAGQLSLKTFKGGTARYRVNNAHYLVDDQVYLLLNNQQTYAISVEAAETARVESFCLFFEDGLAEEVYYSLNTSTGKLLDCPQWTNTTRPLQFFERTYQRDASLDLMLAELQIRLTTTSNEATYPQIGWMQEQICRIMGRLLELHAQIYRETETLTALRRPTREELYSRLHQASDFIRACYDEPLTLDQIAQCACLSPNHLLRTFKQLFGQTPHQYLTAYRLEKACQLLKASPLSVTEISGRVGFESLGSFSWLFRRHFGVSPQQYRQQNG